MLLTTALIRYSDKFLLYTCIYTDEEQLSVHFYYFDPLKRDKQGWKVKEMACF